MYNASAYRYGDEIKNQNFGTEEKPEILFDDEYAEYEEDFYLIPKETQMGAVTDPYYYSFTDDEADQEFMTSVVFPIIYEEIFLGVVGTDISLATLEQINQHAKLYDSGFSAIITHSGMIAMHPDSSYIEQNISDIFYSENDSLLQNLKTAVGFSYTGRSNYLDTEVLRSFVPINITGTPDVWWVMTEVPVNEIYTDARKLAIDITIAGILGMLLISLVVYLISRNITQPVQRNANLMQQIAAGHLPSIIETENRHDEIGRMSRSAEEMLIKLKEIMEKINIGSTHTASATKEINRTAQTIAQGANEQAASAEEVSATIEEMLSSLEYNKNKTLEAETIAAEARKSIESGNHAAQESVNAVTEIAETITIINEIAGKTDLLAINAAIEAARAGNQGKGFAVVAKEIRKLAVKSQNAAQKIEELSRNSLSVSKKSGELLLQAVPKVQNTAQIIKEIARANEEQNRGADQIAKAVEELNRVTQANTSASEELASNSEEMEAQTEQLKEIVSFFQIKE
jgi:methyl-accepting chemotaxis protein